MSCLLAYSFSLLALVAASSEAEDAVTIKPAYFQPGQRVRITIKEKSTTKMVSIYQGQVQSVDDMSTKSLVYVDEIIERPMNTRVPTKLKRAFEKAVIYEDGQTESLPIEGKTVLIEKKAGNYSFTVDGKTVDGRALKLLEQEFNRNEEEVSNARLPKKPIKPGGTWKADPEDINNVLGDRGTTFAKSGFESNGILVKAYKKNGKQFGVIEFVCEAPITNFGKKAPVTVRKGKMILKVISDGCTDGSDPTARTTTTWKVEYSGAIIGAEAALEMKAAVESTENRMTELLPKK